MQSDGTECVFYSMLHIVILNQPWVPGDLYFRSVEIGDSLNGRLYACQTYNPILNATTVGGHGFLNIFPGNILIPLSLCLSNGEHRTTIHTCS